MPALVFALGGGGPQTAYVCPEHAVVGTFTGNIAYGNLCVSAAVLCSAPLSGSGGLFMFLACACVCSIGFLFNGIYRPQLRECSDSAPAVQELSWLTSFRNARNGITVINANPVWKCRALLCYAFPVTT